MANYSDLLQLYYKRQRDRVRIMKLTIEKHQRRKHRYWEHNLIKTRSEQGAYHQLVRELELDSAKFHQYFRMSGEKMDFVLAFIGPLIEKSHVVREPISAKQKLAICLRFLATGESYTSLAMQYRVGITTVSRLVPEVCGAIWDSMRDTFLKLPENEAQWKVVADDYERKWNYPHCIGAIDGKHVVIKSPINSGSMYYNYKSSFSIILMALVDANAKFMCVDIGAYGRQSDPGVFGSSILGQALTPPNSLNLPCPEPIEGAEHLGPLPYVVIGDEAFPLQEHLMRPFPGKKATPDQDAYNYRQSRARRIVECAFGIMATRFRVFYTRMSICPDNVVKVIQGSVILHNMLQSEPTAAINIESAIEEQNCGEVQALHAIEPCRRGTAGALDIRNAFKDYFVENPLPWQTSHIERGLH